jgi:hypothetical protein
VTEDPVKKGDGHGRQEPGWERFEGSSPPDESDADENRKKRSKTMKRYRIKGVNDDLDTCDLCGKTGLKKVAWLVELDAEGDEIGIAAPYGCCCAAKLLAQSTTPLKSKTRSTQYAELENMRRRDVAWRITQKRQELGPKFGLIECDGFWVFPDDMTKIKTLFGPERIRLIRKSETLHPIFSPFAKEDSLSA